MLKRLLPLLLLAIGGCGYHLAGQGESGAIGSGVKTVSIQAVGISGAMLSEFKNQLMRSYGAQLTLVESELDVANPAAHIHIRLDQSRENLIPKAYDASGVTSQYELTLSANVHLYQGEALVWESGMIEESGDIYIAGGPSGIEASKQRLLRDLHKQWATRAVQRLRSGF